MISFSCPGCGQRLQARDEMAGKALRCPRCRQAVQLPAAPARPAPTDPTLMPGPAAPPPLGSHTAAASATGDPAPDTRQPRHEFLAPPQGPGEMGRLGRYRVLEVLGQGGMGVVFLAEDTLLRRRVALKAMRPAIAESESNRQRFLREAQTAAALEHDHVVTVLDFGEDRGVPFLAMPLLKGESLEARLQREGPLPLAEVLRVGREVADGLAAAHDKGMVHRDIKPGNVWLEGDRRRAKVLDFGLARPVTDGAALTQAGTVVGTPSYMAPEQARGEAVDSRCDLFSLGCLLYRMLTGEPPFKGRDAIGTLVAVATQHPRPVAELSPGAPPSLAGLIGRLLAKDRERRPPSAAAVVDAIRAIEEDRTEVLLPVPPTRPPTPPPLPAAAAQRRPARKRGLLIPLLTLLLLVGVGVAGFFALRGGASPDEDDRPEQTGNGGDGGPGWGERTTLSGPAHTDTVQGLAFSHDGRLLASAGADRRLKLWNVSTGKHLRDLSGATVSESFRSVAFSPDGKRLAAGGASGALWVWDVASGRPSRLHINSGGSTLSAVCFSPDGLQVAADGATDHRVRVWNAATGRQANALTGHTGAVHSIAISPDGRRLVSAAREGPATAPRGFRRRVRLWELATRKEVPLGEANGAAAFSPDSKRLACGTTKGEVRILGTEMGVLFHTFKSAPGPLDRVCFSDDGGRLVAVHGPARPSPGGGDKTVKVWDVRSGRELLSATLNVKNRLIDGEALGPGGTLLALADANFKIYLWNLEALRRSQAKK